MINKVYISYFYQVRNMNQNYLPISTAMWDPKWFHGSKDNLFIFIDKNGVYNGVRMESLVPDKSCEGLCFGRRECPPFINPPDCEFIQTYKAQLSKIDFNQLLAELTQLLKSYSIATGVEDPMPVFLVYEKPDNPCSERESIIEWFKSNGIECEEWDKKRP